MADTTALHHLGGNAYCHPSLADQCVPIDTLIPYPGNARIADQDAITASIRDLGLYRPCTTQQSTNHVLTGNHTRQALLDLGATMCPVTWLDVDDTTARAINLRDNHTTDDARYDDRALLALLEAASAENALALAGYEPVDLTALRLAVQQRPTLTDPDDVPDKPAQPVSQPGDLWLLSPDHVLLVGDSTHPGNVAIVLAPLGGVADMVWTDPPYGVSYVGGTGLTIENDDLSTADLAILLHGAFTAFRDVLRPGGAFYVCSPAGALETVFRVALDAVGLELRQQIVWAKDRFVLGRMDYHWRHETVLYGWTEGDPVELPLYDEQHDTILYGWQRGARHTWQGGRKQDTVWNHPRPARSDVHPTMKPVSLVARGIENSSTGAGVVLDVFAGSGSTAIAAYGLGRRSASIELDAAYADVICRRWQAHTGLQPVLAATGVAHDFGEVVAGV